MVGSVTSTEAIQIRRQASPCGRWCSPWSPLCVAVRRSTSSIEQDMTEFAAWRSSSETENRPAHNRGWTWARLDGTGTKVTVSSDPSKPPHSSDPYALDSIHISRSVDID